MYENQSIIDGSISWKVKNISPSSLGGGDNWTQLSDFALVNHNHDDRYSLLNHTHINATTTTNGFMSSDDKSIINLINENIVIVPRIDRSDLGYSSYTTDYPTYLEKWLKYICTIYNYNSIRGKQIIANSNPNGTWYIQGCISSDPLNTTTLLPGFSKFIGSQGWMGSTANATRYYHFGTSDGNYSCHQYSISGSTGNYFNRSGYEKLNSGLILQWKFVYIKQSLFTAQSSWYYCEIEYPISFPNAGLAAFGQKHSGTSWNIDAINFNIRCSDNNNNKTKWMILADEISSFPTNDGFGYHLFAIGY